MNWLKNTLKFSCAVMFSTKIQSTLFKLLRKYQYLYQKKLSFQMIVYPFLLALWFLYSKKQISSRTFFKGWVCSAYLQSLAFCLRFQIYFIYLWRVLSRSLICSFQMSANGNKEEIEVCVIQFDQIVSLTR